MQSLQSPMFSVSRVLKIHLEDGAPFLKRGFSSQGVSASLEVYLLIEIPVPLPSQTLYHLQWAKIAELLSVGLPSVCSVEHRKDGSLQRTTSRAFLYHAFAKKTVQFILGSLLEFLGKLGNIGIYF